MRSFRARDTVFDRSIAIDASTIDGITVTVAVTADRASELDVLDSIYTVGEDYDFYPFRDKSHDIEYNDRIELFESVISDNTHRLRATAHLGRDGSDPERVEAVQSAVLVNELETTEALIILDGDDDKAKRFGHAITGISRSCPPVTTCIQAELYYPTSLLADLCASYLAHQIKHADHCYEVVPSAPITKDSFSRYWGKAYNAMVNSSGTVRIEAIEQCRAETVRGRVNCWFDGQMGGGDPIEYDGSVRPIAEYVRGRGYDKLAMHLSQI